MNTRHSIGLRPKIVMRNPGWIQGRSKEHYSSLNSVCNDVLPGNNNLISCSIGQAEASLCFQEGDCCWGSWKQQRAAILHFFTSLHEPHGFKLLSLTTELSFHEQDPQSVETTAPDRRPISEKICILEKPAPELITGAAPWIRSDTLSTHESSIHSSVSSIGREKGNWTYSSFWKGEGQRFTTAIWDWKADPANLRHEVRRLHGGILISHDGQPIYIRCRLDGRLLEPSISLWETTIRRWRIGHSSTTGSGYRCYRLTPSPDQNSNLELIAAELNDKVISRIFDASNKPSSNLQPQTTSATLFLDKQFAAGKDKISDNTAPEVLETFTHDDYRIAIICALPKELLAVRSLFDQRHPVLEVPEHDTNHYAFGSIAGHIVVAASLPSGLYGTCSAANVANQLRSSFTNIQFCLLVGIGGGVPSESHDIRLGDVVVSNPTGQYPGIIKYDFGKAMDYGVFQQTGSLRGPPHFLLSAISDLTSDPDLDTEPLKQHLDRVAIQKPKYCFPGVKLDKLFQPAFPHVNLEVPDDSCSECHGPTVARSPRSNTQPFIHYGLIASGDRVMRSAQLRDEIGRKYGALCFDMEAAGIANVIPCLTIRGICDYSDSHKNKIWQEYASASAAAYAKVLLTHVRHFR